MARDEYGIACQKINFIPRNAGRRQIGCDPEIGSGRERRGETLAFSAFIHESSVSSLFLDLFLDLDVDLDIDIDMGMHIQDKDNQSVYVRSRSERTVYARGRLDVPSHTEPQSSHQHSLPFCFASCLVSMIRRRERGIAMPCHAMPCHARCCGSNVRAWRRGREVI